jgi:hypothetical protein
MVRVQQRVPRPQLLGAQFAGHDGTVAPIGCTCN